MSWQRVVIAVALVVAAAGAQATFAASTGFSGRFAFTCVQCHADVGGADVVLSGVPDAWDPEARYEIAIMVAGGPAPLPFAPQGGFEADTDAGRLIITPGMEQYTRPAGTGITYTEAGTDLRAWSVDWIAPDLVTPPSEARIWVAAMAANGNHNRELNISDGGESGDATAHTVVVIPPSAATLATWEAMPLAPPQVTFVPDGGGFIRGEQTDENATAIQWRFVGDEDWIEDRASEGWQIAWDGGRDIEIRSSGYGRVSTGQVIEAEQGFLGTPAIGPVLLLGLLAVAAVVARRR